jgi:hypothetical protein
MNFSVGEKVHMRTNLRILNGFVEKVATDHIRVRWEDDTIGMLVFEWQRRRLEHGWSEPAVTRDKE